MVEGIALAWRKCRTISYDASAGPRDPKGSRTIRGTGRSLPTCTAEYYKEAPPGLAEKACCSTGPPAARQRPLTPKAGWPTKTWPARISEEARGEKVKGASSFNHQGPEACSNKYVGGGRGPERKDSASDLLKGPPRGKKGWDEECRSVVFFDEMETRSSANPGLGHLP